MLNDRTDENGEKKQILILIPRGQKKTSISIRLQNVALSKQKMGEEISLKNFVIVLNIEEKALCFTHEVFWGTRY